MGRSTLLLLAAVVLAAVSLAAAVTLSILNNGDAYKAWDAFGAALIYIVGVHTPAPPASS